MTTPLFLPAHDGSLPIDLVTPNGLETYLSAQSEFSRTFLDEAQFKAGAGEIVRLPDMTGRLARIVFGVGDGKDGLALAGLSSKLKGGVYRFDYLPEETDVVRLAVAWADGAYRFTKYKARDHEAPSLVITDDTEREKALRFASAIDLLRDLVNTTAEDMGPSGLHAAFDALADTFGAKFTPVVGDDLLSENYPMIHAVGRAAADAPRLLELTWGDPSHPVLAIVGKGVTFDTGGLNIKVNDYMRLMKKDMGGSAHAIALAHLVMAHNLPVHLKLVVPAVENAVSAGAFRPSDILQSRKGLTVEIENTDAEGRLVLADALTRAQEGTEPDLLIDFATLTGAARVAMGTEVAPFYTDDEELADAIAHASCTQMDPAWRLPLWPGYEHELKSPIADLKNTGNSAMGGSITAALFLKNFVDVKTWVHWDVWAWRLAKYGNPAGGAATGLRAMFEVIEKRYGA